jgi:hypothetical protein
MIRNLIAIAIAALMPGIALAQVCPAGSTCTPVETYFYGQGNASAPYGSGLKVVANPNGSASSAQNIPGNLLLDTTSAQTATNKTFTSPAINGATLSGTIAGNFTFSGVPIFSGLSSGSCTNGVALDAGGHLVTVACGGGGGLTVGTTTIASGTNAFLLFNNSGVLGNEALTAAMDIAFGSTRGSIVQRGAGGWGALTPGTAGYFLQTAGPGLDNSWQPSGGGSGITQLTGDVTAGPGTGSQAATIAAGAVTSAKMASGAAATNVGTVGGDLTGTLPNPTITANAVTTPKINNAAVTYAKIQNEAASTLLGNPTGAPAAPSEITLGTNLSFAGTVLNATGGGGNFFTTTAATGGTSTAYTLAMAGYTATVGNFVCAGGGLNVASGLNPTLNVQATGAKPIKLFSGTGLVSLVNNELPTSGQICWTYDGTNYVVQTPAAVAASPIATTDTVTPAKFSSGQSYNIITAGQTITLPPAATSPTGGAIFISTGDVTAQLCVTGATGDVINNGQVGGGVANGCITLPANLTNAPVQTSGVAGATAFTVPLGPLQYFSATLYGGTLSAAASFGHVATPRTVYAVSGRVDTPSGVAGTLDMYSVASGTPCTSGTKLSNTSFLLNGPANTNVDLGLFGGVPIQVPAGYDFCFGITTGAPISNGGTERIQVTYR